MSEQPPSIVHCSVARLRARRGMSQDDLASRCGVSRQALSAIERGRATPSTAIALRLARALDTTVEHCFTLVEEIADVARPAVVTRACSADVRGRLVTWPLAGEDSLGVSFAPADAVRAAGAWSRVPGTPRPELTVLLEGCDPALGLLANMVRRLRPDHRVLWRTRGSLASLDALREGRIHVAGVHVRDAVSGENNLPLIRRRLGSGAHVYTFACWEQGLIAQPGNPLALRSWQDLEHPGVRLINRERGSSARLLLDDALARLGLPASRLAGYGAVARSHVEAAQAVAHGAATVAVGCASAAYAYGLSFTPLTQERFDLVFLEDPGGHPVMTTLLEALRTAALRQDVGSLAGYEVTTMGGRLQ